ncbi:hypothetical protein B0H10DRAFT_1953123 [Mycena sp. CBHHK59/15]|nr:hypothetical protein B0H10DRAFT_1953123 [Mycena sp. CBHHK59/15]
MDNSIASTNGIYLTAVFLQAILQGMGLMQGFLYFVWYPKDTWSVKGTEVYSNVFNSVLPLEISGLASTTSIRFIGNVDTIFSQPLVAQGSTRQGGHGRTDRDGIFLGAFINQHKIIPILIFLLSLVALGCGLGQVISSIQLKQYSALGKLSVTDNLQASFALTADILITFGLCWRLAQNRSGIQSYVKYSDTESGSDHLQNQQNTKLPHYDGHKSWGLHHALCGAEYNLVYMNSMLAMLNTREYAVHFHGRTIVEHISMPVYKSTAPQNTITVTTVNQTCPDDKSLEEGKPQLQVD